MFLLMLPKFAPVNLLKPSDYYMWETDLHFKSTVCPHFAFLFFFARSSQKRAMASLHSINRTWVVISVMQKLIFIYCSNKFNSSKDLIIRACWICKNHFTNWDNYSCRAVKLYAWNIVTGTYNSEEGNNIIFTSRPTAFIHSSIHLVICLRTGPKPFPKPALHTVRSRATSFQWGYPLLSLISSSSFLRLLPRLPVTSTPPFIFPSITCYRWQFIRKLWPIQLAFHLFVSCRIFLCSLTLHQGNCYMNIIALS